MFYFLSKVEGRCDPESKLEIFDCWAPDRVWKELLRGEAMKTMKHKGYSARIEYSDEDGCFVGHIAGIRDVVGFHGEAVSELRAAFEEAVDDYLEICKKTGKQPQKPYSGKLMLLIPPKVHAAVAQADEVSGKSINQWAADMLDQAAHFH
jgi:predicted HicB family RNase H-like nuclease